VQREPDPSSHGANVGAERALGQSTVLP
jgi:hypothetical protein